MIRVLALALYGPLAASTRYRLLQYVDGLARLGIDLQVRCLLNDDYLRHRFDHSATALWPIVKGLASRLQILVAQSRVDLFMVHCELFPFLPAPLERILLRKPYLYDFDDAFYLRYRLGARPVARTLLGNKFDTVLAGAASVTAGNAVLEGYAVKFNRSVSRLPTVVDTTRYLPVKRTPGRALRIGWIGSPSTASYLPELVAPLSRLGLEGPVELVVIGGKAPAISNVDVIELPWSEDTEIVLINSFDIGVMPLPDDEWARGKCAFKLVQYMACAVPVVASPVGANRELVSPECGLLAGDENAWLDCLRQLRDDPGLRQQMGEAGRQRIVEHYSLHTALPKLAHVIQSAVGRS
ncbi:MAG: glycosyltransferase family 4 protein [Pseudomonadota bacterium]